MSKDFDERIENFFKNYQDRGMKKWAGYYLSDHTAKINQDNAKKAIVYQKRPTMTIEQISEVLAKAYLDHYPVSVQLKLLNSQDEYQADIYGFVEGYNGDQIIIAAQLLRLSEINNILLKK
ncbi:hypothetical protein [Lactobacillus hominis]|uniref:DNA-directed RNA polymerase beta subunit n=2 Tax=Lactobacillus hominis TaxID=1203033 RepID=I7KGK1_9LACO|nr:hypothetical protein [Lactobacillus hominis]MCT3347662.1 hypothetical protein [Lactobacillus hominis]CCI81325.1 Putative uncharacterized protein [Lactobacillus hominis DSM 23910 = CRBIP 24.179]